VSWQKEGGPMPTNGQDEIPGSYFQSLKGGHFKTVGNVPPFFPHELHLHNYLGDTLYYDPEKGGTYGDASGNGLANAFYYLFNLGDPRNPSIIPLTPGETSGTPAIQAALDGSSTYSYIHPRNDNQIYSQVSVS